MSSEFENEQRHFNNRSNRRFENVEGRIGEIDSRLEDFQKEFRKGLIVCLSIVAVVAGLGVGSVIAYVNQSLSQVQEVGR